MRREFLAELFSESDDLDGRSALYNTEVGLIIDSDEIAADVRQLRIHDEIRSAYRLRLRDQADRAVGQAV